MDFNALLDEFTAAVEAGDGKRLARLFTPDGVYDDTFYGEFQGHEAIRAMLEEHFWRDATAFRWDMLEPLDGGSIGYSRWVFSYTSQLPEARGERITFEGMSRFRLRDGLIERYDEVFDAGIALAQTGFPAERIARIAARRAEALRRRHAGSRHLRP